MSEGRELMHTRNFQDLVKFVKDSINPSQPIPACCLQFGNGGKDFEIAEPCRTAYDL